jgi:prepilin-type N-terminal cleavage/methylation domain-containing protein
MHKTKGGFTLVEVLIAVMIISVVIMALLQMNSNTTHIYTKFKDSVVMNQVQSLFISNKKFGFESNNIHLDDLLKEFKVEDELRRELKSKKINISYKILNSFNIDLGDEGMGISKTLEIGKTIIKMDNLTTSIIRFRIR